MLPICAVHFHHRATRAINPVHAGHLNETHMCLTAVALVLRMRAQ